MDKKWNLKYHNGNIYNILSNDAQLICMVDEKSSKGVYDSGFRFYFCFSGEDKYNCALFSLHLSFGVRHAHLVDTDKIEDLRVQCPTMFLSFFTTYLEGKDFPIQTRWGTKLMAGSRIIKEFETDMHTQDKNGGEKYYWNIEYLDLFDKSVLLNKWFDNTL